MSPIPILVDSTDAIVRVTSACIYGSDLWPYAEMECSEVGQSMRHEGIGVVEDVGADAATLERGELVVMPFVFSDGSREPWHAGLHTACVHVGSSATTTSTARRLGGCGSRSPTASSTSWESATATGFPTQFPPRDENGLCGRARSDAGGLRR
jgi:threonine dehydrogenase-like Zn-dependent dehydrogenase